jgi:branched-subunit amino acid transport protein
MSTLAMVLGLAAVTAVLKGTGAMLSGVPDAVVHRIAGLAPALLAALAVTETTGHNGVPQLDAKLAGVGTAVLLSWKRAPFAVAVVAGAVVAAVLRAVAP